MKFLKVILIIIASLLPSAVEAQNPSPEGIWSPDKDCFLGEIRIRNIIDNEYKIRFETSVGVKVGEISNQKDGKMSTTIEWLPADEEDYYVYNRTRHSFSGHYDKKYDVRVPATTFLLIRLKMNGNQMIVHYQVEKKYIYHGQLVHSEICDERGPIYYTRW